MERYNLYMFRCGKKLTKGAMAKVFGCSRTTYSYIEKGLRNGEQKVWENFQRAFGIPDSEMWHYQKLVERTDQNENAKKGSSQIDSE